MKNKLSKAWTPYVKKGSPFWRIRRWYHIRQYKLYIQPYEGKEQPENKDVIRIKSTKE